MGWVVKLHVFSSCLYLEMDELGQVRVGDKGLVEVAANQRLYLLIEREIFFVFIHGGSNSEPSLLAYQTCAFTI